MGGRGLPIVPLGQAPLIYYIINHPYGACPKYLMLHLNVLSLSRVNGTLQIYINIYIYIHIHIDDGRTLR